MEHIFESVDKKAAADEQQLLLMERLLTMVQEKQMQRAANIRMDRETAQWFSRMALGESLDIARSSTSNIEDMLMTTGIDSHDDLEREATAVDAHTVAQELSVPGDIAPAVVRQRHRRRRSHSQQADAAAAAAASEGESDASDHADDEAAKKAKKPSLWQRFVALLRWLRHKVVSGFVALVAWMNHSTAVVQQIYFANPACMDNFTAHSTPILNFFQGLYFLLVVHTHLLCFVLIIFNVCYNANLLVNTKQKEKRR